MLDDISAFNLILAFLGIFGIIAVAIGFYGTFLVLTGGDDVRNPQVEVLGAAACDDEPRLDNLDQPYVGQPDLSYQPPAALFTNVTITTTAGETTLNASADGRIIKTGAVGADGVEVPVMVNETDRRLSVQTTTQPIRVWIEATSNSDAFSTELRVCPGS
jgi:hypothetical protein